MVTHAENGVMMAWSTAPESLPTLYMDVPVHAGDTGWCKQRALCQRILGNVDLAQGTRSATSQREFSHQGIGLLQG